MALPYVQNLRKLGIDVQVRTVDPAQYQQLMDDFDFDMTMMIYPGSDMPGNELRDYWSCAAAKATGSSNVPGICDPAIDALIEKVIAAPGPRHAAAPPRARWTACCCGAGTWCRTGTRQDFHIAYWDRFGDPGHADPRGLQFRQLVDRCSAKQADADASDEAARQRR